MLGLAGAVLLGIAAVVVAVTMIPQVGAVIPWPWVPMTPTPTANASPTPGSTATRSPTQTPQPTRTATPDAAARELAATQELRRRADEGAASVTKSGQWVAQLASKYVGITDARQTSASGSHTFYAVDILAESQALASRVSGVQVVLLDSTTYGKRFNHNGAPLWVTMALSSRFQSSDDVKTWCAAQFPELSGDELNNQCMANRLNP